MAIYITNTTNPNYQSVHSVNKPVYLLDIWTVDEVHQSCSFISQGISTRGTPKGRVLGVKTPFWKQKQCYLRLTLSGS